LSSLFVGEKNDFHRPNAGILPVITFGNGVVTPHSGKQQKSIASKMTLDAASKEKDCSLYKQFKQFNWADNAVQYNADFPPIAPNYKAQAGNCINRGESKTESASGTFAIISFFDRLREEISGVLAEVSEGGSDTSFPREEVIPVKRRRKTMTRLKGLGHLILLPLIG
jgi:hypothetical protein